MEIKLIFILMFLMMFTGTARATTYENLSTYTETDPNGNISIISDNIASTINLPRNVDAYLYSDKTTGNITNFSIKFDFQITAGNLGISCFAVSNSVDDCLGNTNELSVIQKADGIGSFVQLRDVGNGGELGAAKTVGLTKYYYMLNRTRSGANYSVNLSYYSDAGYTSLVDYSTINQTFISNYRYLYAIQSYNDGNPNAINATIGNISFTNTTTEGSVQCTTYCIVATDGTGNYTTDGTDDQVQINNAINATAPYKGTVHINVGTYIINSSIMLKSNVTLEGNGWGTIIKAKDNTSGYWVSSTDFGMVMNENYSTQDYNITIKNITIDGDCNWTTNFCQNQTIVASNSNLLDPLKFQNLEGGLVKNVKTNSSICDGIAIVRNVYNVSILDSTLAWSYHDGIQSYQYSSGYLYISNNSCLTATNSCYRFTGVSNSLVENNTAKQVDTRLTFNGYGVYFGYTGSDVIHNNTIRNNTINFTDTGIWLQAWNPSGAEPTNHRILNNKISDINNAGNSNSGIRMQGFRNAVIESNTIAGGSSGSSCIYADTAGANSSYNSSNITVKNNICANFTKGLYSTVTNPFLNTYNNLYNLTTNYSNSTAGVGEIYTNPLFATFSSDFKTIDFHLQSAYGRWNGSAWVNDSSTSPAIDAGDPSSDYSLEPSPNGSRINMGAYGNTAEASKSSSEGATIYIPPVPVWVSNTTGSSWVNHTWQAGAGNVTDSYNVSQNGTWYNGTTATFFNSTISASGWSNITIWAYNASGGLSATSISNNSQVPAAPTVPSVSNVSSYVISTCNSTLNWGIVGAALLGVLILVMGGGLAFGFMSGTIKRDTLPIQEFVLVLVAIVVISSIGVAIIQPIITVIGCP